MTSWKGRSGRARAVAARGDFVKTILIAAVPASAAVISNALGSTARMMTAHTIEDAFEAALIGVDLVIAGTYFDNARMFDLLRRLKSDAKTRHIPVLCVRGVSAQDILGTQTIQPVLASLDIVESASRALGAEDYIDLIARRRDIDVDAASAELARAARAYLGLG